MDGEVADVVGLGGSSGIGFEEGIDDVLAGLEGAGCVKREVAAVVEARSFCDEYWLLEEEEVYMSTLEDHTINFCT